MKLLLRISVLIACLAKCVAANAASFQNLDFESGTFVPTPRDLPFIYFDQAFTGWTGYIGGVSEPTAFSNAICVSACPQLILVDEFIQASPLGDLLEGSLTAALHGGTRNGVPVDATLAQIGLVPGDARSLLFRAQVHGGPFQVSLSGQPLSLSPLLITPDYTLFGADISSWAGREAELSVTAYRSQGLFQPGTLLFVDAIEFSATPIPEPSTLALFAVAGVLGWFCFRRKRG